MGLQDKGGFGGLRGERIPPSFPLHLSLYTHRFSIMIARLQKGIIYAVVVSECSHIFCCVLPTLFSLFSLLAGVGLLGALPAPLVELHEILHEWEIPMIIGSGVILLMGWGLYAVSLRMDCHTTGCGHGPCTPRKNRAGLILLIATILFGANVLVFGVFHRGMGLGAPVAHNHTITHDHTDHDRDQTQPHSISFSGGARVMEPPRLRAKLSRSP